MKTRKAQMNLGFIISIVLLILLIIWTTTTVLNMLPTVQEGIRESNLRARAYDLSYLLMDDPGNPREWEKGTPTRISLAVYNNYSNETMLGNMDLTKISQTNSTYSYDFLRNSLGLNNTTSIEFRLIIENSTGVVLDKYESEVYGGENVVVIRRFAVVNRTQVNVTLITWD